MTMEANLYSYLNGQSSITSIAQTIRWGRLRQDDDLPALVMHVVSRLSANHFGGDSGWYQTRVQFDSMATTQQGYGVSRSLASALIALLDGYKGTIGSGATQGIFFDGEHDFWLEPTDASDIGTFVVSQDFMITHN